MSARQLIVLVVAGIAAVGALLLIRGMGAREAPPAEAVAPISGQQVLVAARDIPQGAALAPGDMAVAVFPDASVAPNFIRLSAQPSAQAEMVGAVTRRPFVRGEPITTVAVVQPEGRGFMAAQLEPGFRAVAIEVERETVAGGYIQPNDRVDVIVTARTRSNEGGGEQVSSNIVLQDVRVLALGDKTQPQTTGQQPEIIEAGIAVLELTAEEARSLALAEELGTLTLALRGVQAETVGLRSNRGEGLSQTSGSVRIHAYGTVIGGGQ